MTLPGNLIVILADGVISVHRAPGGEVLDRNWRVLPFWMGTGIAGAKPCEWTSGSANPIACDGPDGRPGRGGRERDNGLMARQQPVACWLGRRRAWWQAAPLAPGMRWHELSCAVSAARLRHIASMAVPAWRAEGRT